MKLLLENWRKHLKEGQDRYEGRPIGSTTPGTADQKEEQSRKNAIEQFEKLRGMVAARKFSKEIPSRSDEEAALIEALQFAIETLEPAEDEEEVRSISDIWTGEPGDGGDEPSDHIKQLMKMGR